MEHPVPFVLNKSDIIYQCEEATGGYKNQSGGAHLSKNQKVPIRLDNTSKA